MPLLYSFNHKIYNVMKKYLILLALIATSCQVNKAKEDVSAFLNEKYGQLGDIEVIECSPVDSLYSPFSLFNSITLQYLQMNNEVSKEYSKAAEMKSLKAMREQLDKAISISDKELYEDFTKAIFFTDNPDAMTAPKNRLGVKAKYSLDGNENEAYFFYNTSEKTIGHSSLEMKTKVKEITRFHLDFIKRQSEMRSLKAGLY